MIHTESIAYVEVAGRLCPICTSSKTVRKWFVSAPALEDVRNLLRQEVMGYCHENGDPLPVLLITRQTQSTA